MGGIEGSCHCGAVRVTIPHPPPYINDCNCSLCVKHGVIWGYFHPDRVSIAGGPLRAYRRADRAQPSLEVHWCEACGCTTHWSTLPPRSPDRMGVNMRLFEPDATEGVEIRPLDGRAWQS